jgi:hypothetical protein
VKAWYHGRVVLEFRMRFQLLLRGVVTRGGRVGAQPAEALVAGHGPQTVVPFAYLMVTILDTLPILSRGMGAMHPPGGR